MTTSAREARGVFVGDDVLGRGAQYASWTRGPLSRRRSTGAVAAAAGVVGETAERGLRLLEVDAGDTVSVDGGAGWCGSGQRPVAVTRGL